MRPVKEGLDYFPLDVHMDEKIALMEAEFGLTGFAVIVRLFQRIYGRGFACRFGAEEALLFSRETGLTLKQVNEIVASALRRGIFHQEMYEKYAILTSHGIQMRYFMAVTRRKEITACASHLLISPETLPENVRILGVNAGNNPINTRKSTQRKEKKTKPNKTKANESRETPPPPKAEVCGPDRQADFTAGEDETERDGCILPESPEEPAHPLAFSEEDKPGEASASPAFLPASSTSVRAGPSAENPPGKKRYAQFVTLSESEYAALRDQFGEGAALKLIEVLNTFKGATGKTYRSDYLAIRDWVIHKVRREAREENPALPL